MLWSRSHTHHLSTQLTSQTWWPGLTRQPSGATLPCALKGQNIWGTPYVSLLLLKIIIKTNPVAEDTIAVYSAYLFFCNRTPILFKSLSFPPTVTGPQGNMTDTLNPRVCLIGQRALPSPLLVVDLEMSTWNSGQWLRNRGFKFLGA